MFYSFFSYLILAIISFTVVSCGFFEPTPITVTEKNVDTVIQSQKDVLEEDKENPQPHYLLAQAYLKKKDYLQAEKNIIRAIQLSLRNGRYFELLGDISFQAERYGMSTNAYKKAIRLQPNLISSYVKLALVYEQTEEIELAIASLEESISREPLLIEGHYHLGRMYLKKREYTFAIEIIESTLNLEPNNKETLLLQIQAHSEKGDYFVANTLIQQFLEIFPNNYDAQHEQLKIYFARRQWKKALAYNRKMAQNHNFQFEDDLIKALILIHLNQLGQAELILTSLSEKKPLHPEVMTELALLSLRRGDLSQALEMLNRRIEVDDSQPVPFFLQAVIFFKQRKYLQGDLALKRALEFDALNPDFQLLFLRRRLMKGELGAVDQGLKALLNKDPVNPKFLTLQVDLLTLQNKFEKAEKLIRQIQLIQESSILDFYLARVFYLKGEYHAVLPLTEKLIQKFPHDWESIYLHSLSLYQLGKMKKALPLLEPFLKQKKGEGFLHLLVGNLYRFEGELKKAQKIYEEGLEIFTRQIYLVDALSATLISQQKWSQANEIMLSVIGKDHPLKPILLDRLIVTAYQLEDRQKIKQYLQLYHRMTDPVLKSLNIRPENQILFPVSSPSLAFPDLTSVLSK